MHPIQISWLLDELADLLELGDEGERELGQAFRRGAQTALAWTKDREDPEELDPEVAKVYKELAAKGHSSRLDQLRQTIPKDVQAMIHIPGLTPEGVGVIHRHLAVDTLEGLYQAARKRRVRTLPGIGPKTELYITRGIDMLNRDGGFFPIGVAKQVADGFSDFMQALFGETGFCLAGPMRRGTEMVREVLFVAAYSHPQEALDLFCLHPLGKGWNKREGNRATIRTWSGIPVTLRVVDREDYPWAVLEETGSREHLEALVRIAEEQRIEGRFKVGKSEPSLGEGPDEPIYQALNLPFIPPEIRESGKEVEQAAAGKLPRLVELSDIRGDLHMHSNWSDGVSSLEAIGEAAQKRGYEYVAVTDHSRSLTVARGMSADDLLRQGEEIDRLNEGWTNFRILKGIEVDILSEGGLDYPDEVLESLDVVVASVHQGMNQPWSQIRDRMEGAMKNPHVDIIAHPTGRLLGRREGYGLDVEWLMEMAAKTGKILEINSSPDRLDLKGEHAARALDYGVMMTIDTDAHDAARLGDMAFGVTQARRGGLSPKEILNTRSLEDLLKVLSKNKATY